VVEDVALELVAAMTENTLHFCADGSYIKGKKQGSHAWVFANNQCCI
jgi:hypothetical protein